MVYEARKQSMAWTETDYSKDAHFRWKIKLRLEHLGALGIMGETAPLTSSLSSHPRSRGLFPTPPEKVLGTRMLSSPLSIVIVLCSLRVSISYVHYCFTPSFSRFTLANIPRSASSPASTAEVSADSNQHIPSSTREDSLGNKRGKWINTMKG